MMNSANRLSNIINHMTKTLIFIHYYCKAAFRALFQALATALVVLLLVGCASTPKEAPPNEGTSAYPAVVTPPNVVISPSVVTPPSVFVSPPTPSPFPASWSATPLNALPNFHSDNPLAGWSALQSSCQRLSRQTVWANFCAIVQTGTPSSNEAAQAILTKHLVAYQQIGEQGSSQGIATGYFEPIYPASLSREGVYQWPVYAAPEPMTSLSREQLTPASGTVHPAIRGRELAWMSSSIDAFLAQVQGSTRITLPNGSSKRLMFAGKNGQPYVSIANTLVAQGAFTLQQASMERIRTWAASQSPAKVQQVLNTNPSFVFFKWSDTPPELGAVGALGVPLTPLRSVAVDPAFTPLGTPIWLDTTTANGALSQLMSAQDTGSAIKGAARVDIYFGTGDAAGALAGRQKYPSRVWVLWPK